MDDVGAIRVRLGADFEKAGFDQFDRALEAAGRKNKVEAELGADFDERKFIEYERQLAKIERRAKDRNAFKASLGADFDGRALRAAEAAFRRQERQNESLVRSNDMLERSFNRLGKSVGNMIPGLSFTSRIPVYQFGALAGGAAAAVPPVVALTGSLGPLAGWLGAIPGLAAAAGGGLLTAFLGLNGVGEALGAAWEGQLSAAEDGVDAAKRQEGAVEQVRNAEKALEDALESREDAQDAVNDATADATRELRDMRIEAQAANATEQERVERLREAREELGRLRVEGAGQREIAAAQREVTFAEVELARTRAQNRDDAKALREAEESGIRRMPQVLEARERLKDAERAVADAQRGVQQASVDAGRALAESSGGAKKLEEAMAELSPAGQAFVTLLATKFFPVVKRLRATAQEGLLPGVGRGLVEAQANLPVLERMVARYSKTLGDAAEQQGRFWGLSAQGRDMEQIFGQGERLIRKSADASIDWQRGLTHVGVAAEPLLDWAGDMNVELADMFETWAEGGRETGRFERFFRRTIQTTRDVVGGVWDFGRALINIGGIGARVWGDDLRGGIRGVARDFRAWTESVKGERSIERYFERWRERWTDIKNAIGDVIDRYKDLRRDGASSTQALTRIMVETISDAFVELAERIGRLAPRAAWGFIKGFLGADAWGKLAIGAWLIGKLGGRKAFIAIGRTVGQAFAGSFAGSAILGYISSFTGRLRRTTSPGGKVHGSARSAGGRAGRAFGLVFVGAAMVAVSEFLADKLASVIVDNLDDLPGPLRKIAEKALGIDDQVVGEYDVIPEDIRSGPAPFQPRNPIGSKDVGGRQGGHRKRREGEVRDAGKDLDDLERKSDRTMARVSRNMGRHTADGARAVAKNFRIAAQAITRRIDDGEVSTQKGMRGIRRLMATHSEAGKEAAGKSFNEFERIIRRRMSNAGRLTEQGTKWMRRLIAQELRVYGVDPKEALHIAKQGGTRDDSFRLAGRASGGYVGVDRERGYAAGGIAGRVMAAGGGLIGRWGERGRDLVHAVVGRGEAVLNHYQQRIVNAALRVSGLARGGLREVFGRTRGTRHYMAEGGIAGEPQAYAGGGIVELLHPFNDPEGHGGGNSHLHIAMRAAKPIVALGRRLQRMGWLVSEHPAFGGVDPVHSKNSYHYKNQAIDVNWPDAGQEAGKIRALLPMLGGMSSAVATKLARLVVRGPDSPLKALVQAQLDQARKGAQSRLDSFSEIGASMGAISGDGDVESIFAKVARRLSRSKIATLALGMAGYAESGMRDLDYGDSTSQGALQLLASTAAGLGISPHDEGAIASAFLKRGFYGRGGANDLAAQGLPAHLVAQNVQGSAFSDGSNYLAQEGPARAWMARFGLASGGFAGGDGGSIADYIPSAGGFASGGIVAPMGPGGEFTKNTNGALTRIRNRIIKNEGLYQSRSERWQLDDRELIDEGDENTPPSLNMAAIEDRSDDLRKLIAYRQKVYDDYELLVDYLEKLRRTWRGWIKSLTRSIRTMRGRLRGLGKGKKNAAARKALEGRLGKYEGALKGAKSLFADYGTQLQEATVDRYDAETLLIGDKQELDDLLPGAQADIAGRHDRPTAAEDSGTIEDAAAQAREMFAQFTENRRALFAEFGNNFAPLAPSGTTGGGPFGDATQQAAGMRYFGAAGAASGGDSVIGAAGGAAMAGGRVINVDKIEQHFPVQPDPHTWARGVEFELGALA